MRIRYAIIALLAYSMTPAYADQPARSYDQAGHYTGRSERSGDTIRYYDRDGHLIGVDKVQNGSVDHYDAAGHLIGRTTR